MVCDRETKKELTILYSIYLVDDEPLILEGLKQIITWEILDCRLSGSAIHPTKALDEIKNNPVDILITDIRMPTMDGLTLIREVQTVSPHTKFIILSGHNDFSYVQSAFKLGIENYLLKPINEQELNGTLEATLSKLAKEKNQQTLTLLNQHIIRNNTLNKWMSGDTSFYELKERGSLLKLPFKQKYYQVGLLKPFISYTKQNFVNRPKETRPPHHNIYMNLYHFIQDYFPKEDSPLLFITNNDEIGFIFYGSNPDLFTPTLANKIRDIIWHTNVNQQLNLFFALGQIHSGAKNIYKSHDEAKQALTKRFSKNEPILTYQMDELSSPIENTIFYMIERDTLNKFIVNKDLLSIKAHTQELIYQLHTHTSNDPRNFYHAIFYLLLTLNAIGEELGIDTLDHDHFSYTTLMNLGTLKDVVYFIHHYTTVLIESLGSVDLTKSPIVLQIILEVQTGYMSALSIKELSSRYKVNATYLGQLFKQEIGDTFNSYLNKFRINKAKELLLDGSLNLKAGDVAKEVGYNNPNYFYRMFKKYMGLSPKEIKQYRHS